MMVRLALLRLNLAIACGGRSSSATIRPLSAPAMADQDNIALRCGEVRLPDEAPASFDNVRQQFAARGLERRVACEVLADPRAVFDLQFRPR